MLRKLLLIIGFVLWIIQQYILPVTAQIQFIIFLVGIVLLGVPHGAADLLIATQHAVDKKLHFNKLLFFTNYLCRLVLFGLILWFFPLAGNILFIFFAAYHFGETDLSEFKTDTILGKLLVITYGLVVLGVILLNHFEEAKQVLQQFNNSSSYIIFMNFIAQYRYIILSIIGLLFFLSFFFYILHNRPTIQTCLTFVTQFVLILFILYNLPMVLGFTFYFIFWHSLISLRNIIIYLSKDGLFTKSFIVKQISFYSVLAMGGIILFGLTGYMFSSKNAMLLYIFIGLAVLTAPHMQIMHNMYISTRSKLDSLNKIHS